MLPIVMLSLIAFTSLSDIEEVSEEWIAPGAGISQETVVVFSDNGEMFQSESGPYVGAHVCFVNIDGLEKWRATVVYFDRVVLFQEDCEPVVTPFDFIPYGCSFSSLGTIVVIYDECLADTNRNALRINACTGESIYFDSQPDGFPGPSNIFVWENGSLLFGKGTAEWQVTILCYDSNLEEISRNDYSVTGLTPMSQTKLLLTHGNGIACYDCNDGIIWESEEKRLTGYPLITDQLILLYTQSGLSVVSTENGELIRSDILPNAICMGDPIEESNGESWGCLVFKGSSEQYQECLIQGEANASIVNGDFTSAVSITQRELPTQVNPRTRLAQYNQSLFLFGISPGVCGEGSVSVVTDPYFNPLYAYRNIPYNSNTHLGSGRSIQLSTTEPRLIRTTNVGVELIEIESDK